MASRRHLNVRGKSATLPALTDKDMADLAFGVEQGVDFYALSFVKDDKVRSGGCLRVVYPACWSYWLYGNLALAPTSHG